MQTSKQPRLLLNAEPFGFGPTAAIASFFPHLRDKFDTIGYVGKHHTLDLQRDLPYDMIHDVSDMPKNARWAVLAPIFADYDVFVTAMDYKMAEYAQEAGLKVVYYDALTWYWPEISRSVQDSDLYLGQNFFGVEERLKAVFGERKNVHAVPAIVPDVTPVLAEDREHILINLGGLQNPYWPVEKIADYARSVIRSIKDVLPKDQKVIIAGSEAIAKLLHDEGITTFPREAMEGVLAKSKIAFMTSGLGNIYDAAAYDIPTIWLPPANDSQGQQLDLLKAQGMIDAAIEWHDIIGCAPVSYIAEQIGVLQKIAEMAEV